MTEHGARAGDRSGRLGKFLQRPGADAHAADAAVAADPVTGLATRESLHAWVTEAIDRSKVSSTRAVVAFVDIGLLRDINDSYGPDTGDLLLRSVAGRLSSIDVPGTRVVRYGGAEFVAVFERVAQAEHANQIADFLVELLGQPYDLGSDHLTVDPTVGLALSGDTHDTADDVVHDAHQALVRARDEGRGSTVVYDDTKRGRYATRIDEERIRKALRDDEFLLHYQPIVRMDTGDIVGVEALLRWSAPGATNRGVLVPGDFMPLLEKAGLGAEVGEVVLRKGCEQLQAWNALTPDRPRLFLTCNLGARQLADPEFTQRVVRVIEATGVNPWQLCLDVTEEALRFNRAGTWTALRALKDGGVKLGLDDYGTGNSSLIWLRELRLDLLRIDRVFTNGLATALTAGYGMDNDDATLIRHTAAMAHDLGLLAVAEGIEGPAEAAALAELGVDMGQGYHFGRPMPDTELTAILAPEAADEARKVWDPSQVLESTD